MYIIPAHDLRQTLKAFQSDTKSSKRCSFLNIIVKSHKQVLNNFTGLVKDLRDVTFCLSILYRLFSKQIKFNFHKLMLSVLKLYFKSLVKVILPLARK